MLAPALGAPKLEAYILAASAAQKPRVCYLGTASGDDPSYLTRFYDTYANLHCTPSHVPLFRRTPVDLRTTLLNNDIIHVGGGNTRSMLAVWRHWNIDTILREAWESGIILCGSSAGAICWFEQGLTDSIDVDLTPMTCLGFLPGSACPHYDGEPDRRPAYQHLIATGALSNGYAADDAAALHFINRDFQAAVTARPKAHAYRVTSTNGGIEETTLETRLL
ncbi:MAG TPA: peptidase E [Candidatus Baltobacteraceae bacterium]